jgi:squalene-hopene/tetraprenyl-beta-curcumene cyclase
MFRSVFLGCLFFSGGLMAEVVVPKPSNPEEPLTPKFNATRAAAFIDGVSLDWTRKRQCSTCHTNVPHMLARPKISGGDRTAETEVRKYLEATVKSWETKKPKADYDVVATAFALAGHDAATTGKLSEPARTALDKTWTLQKADGSWAWPDCDWPPLEHDQFYGAAYMAVACAIAPDDYAKTPTALKGLEKLKGYIKKNPPTELHHKMTLVWAATKIDGLVTDDERKTILADVRKLQLSDGSWNLPSLGPYPTSRNGDNRMDIGDGYATGFSVYVLRQAGIPTDDPAIRRGIAWLKANQRESGRWFTESPGGSKARYLTNVGSAFAILALAACGEELVAEGGR